MSNRFRYKIFNFVFFTIYLLNFFSLNSAVQPATRSQSLTLQKPQAKPIQKIQPKTAPKPLQVIKPQATSIPLQQVQPAQPKPMALQPANVTTEDSTADSSLKIDLIIPGINWPITLTISTDGFQSALEGKEITFGNIPAKIDNFKFSLKNNQAQPIVAADVTIFGKKGTLSLVDIKADKISNFDPSKDEVKKAGKIQITGATLRIAFSDPLKIDFLPGNSFSLEYVDIKINKGIVNLTSNTKILNKEVELDFIFSKNEISTKFTLAPTTLGKLINEFDKDPFDKIKLETISFELKRSIETQKSSTAEAPQAGSTPEPTTSQVEWSTTFTTKVDLSELNTDTQKFGSSGLAATASYSTQNGFILTVNSNIKIPVIDTSCDVYFKFYSSKAAQILLQDEAKQGSEAPSASATMAPMSLKKPETQKALALIATKTQTQPTSTVLLRLGGTGKINNVPKLGSVGFKLDAEYSKNGFTLAGSITDPINIADSQLKNAEFVINTTEEKITIDDIEIDPKSFLIYGAITIQGFDIAAKIDIGTNKIAKFYGSVSKKEWQPFADRKDFPTFVRNIKLTDLNVTLDASTGSTDEKGTVQKGFTGELNLSGITEILGVASLKASFKAVKQPGKSGFILSAAIPEGQKLKKDGQVILDGIDFTGSSVTISTIDYQDTRNNISYKQGLNFTASVSLNSGKLAGLSKLIKLNKVEISGVISQNLADSEFRVKLADKITPVNDPIKNIGPIELVIKLPAEVALSITMQVQPSPKDDILTLTGMAGISPAGVDLEAGMPSGIWRNPFGVKGLSLTNLDFGIGIPFAIPPIPYKFQIGAMIGLGELKTGCDPKANFVKCYDKAITFATKYDATKSQIALLAELDDKITLEEIVRYVASQVAQSSGKKIDASKLSLPEISMQDVKFSIAPQKVNVGNITIDQGFTFNGLFNILGERVKINSTIDDNGIKARLDMDPIKIGGNAFVLTAGEDSAGNTIQTLYGGPAGEIDIGSDAQKLFFTAKMNLFDIFTGNGSLNLSKELVDFNFYVKVGKAQNLFKAQINGNANLKAFPNFYLHILLEQNFVDEFKKEALAALSKAQEDVKQAINKAENDVNSLNDRIKQDQNALNNANNSLTQAQNDWNDWKKKLDDADKAINDATAQVTKEKQNAFDKFNAEKQNALNAFNTEKQNAQSKFDAEKQRATNQLNTEKQNANNTLNNAKNSVSGGINDAKRKVDDLENQRRNAQNNIDRLQREIDNAPWYRKVDIGIANGTQIAYWEGVRGTLWGAQQVAYGVLNAANATAQGALNAANATYQGMLNAAQATYNGILDTANKTYQGTLDASQKTYDGILKTAGDTYQATLNTANATLDKVVREVGKDAIVATFQLKNTALEAAKKAVDAAKVIDSSALIAARDTANGTLEAAKTVGVGVIEGGKYVVKGLTETFNIQKIEATLAISDSLSKDQLEFEVKGIIVGQNFDLKVKINFEDIAKAAEDIANKVVDIAKKALKIS